MLQMPQVSNRQSLSQQGADRVEYLDMPDTGFWTRFVLGGGVCIRTPVLVGWLG